MDNLARRAWERCELLARFSEEGEGQLTRTFLSPPMHEVHILLRAWMEQAGMTVRVDAGGNLIGRYPAAQEPAPALLLGSHLDTVPNAGKYDGSLGVLLALAVVEAQNGKRLPFALEVIGFSEEEGVRFRTPYLGSRAASGTFDPALLALTDSTGRSVESCLREFGLDPAMLPEAAYRPEDTLGYLEVHIEQGPVLEERGLPVGVVSAIAGQSRLRLRFAGRASHAGTTPMGPLRRDALAGAAEFVGAVEAWGNATTGLVATVGVVTVEPGASNVIPGAVRLSLDMRHADDEVRENAVRRLLEQAEGIAERRGLTVTVAERSDFTAVPMDDRLRGLLRAAVAAEGIAPVLEMVSGAGHDAAIMARCTPSAMLFLRSPNGGLSHHPDETVWVEDIAVALRVLLRTVESRTNTKNEDRTL